MDATQVSVERYEGPVRPRLNKWIAKKVAEKMKEQGAQGHPLGSFVSPRMIEMTIAEAAQAGTLDIYMVDKEVVGILMYDVGQPWWSHKRVLIEHIVLTLKDEFKGFGRIALERLEEIAKANYCDMILTGSAFCVNESPVANLYMKKGDYTFKYQNYVKVF